MHRLQTSTKILVWAVVLTLFTTWTASAGEKLKPEQIIAKHLESLGNPETRKVSRIINGQAQFFLRVGSAAQVSGSAVMASEENKSLLGMIFGATQYPHEKLGFDGEVFTVAAGLNARRPPLSDFVYAHSEIFKETLVGGALSANWALLYTDKRTPKLQYGGTKKISGRELHVLNYSPKKRSDFQIRLYFDTETFRHVRTEYEQVISAAMGDRPETSSQQREQRNKLIETFSDFKDESGLMLPHLYQIEIIVSGTNSTQQFNWSLSLEKFEFNQEIDPKSFKVITN